ncbi:protein-tyrosine sulfotransferase-like [Forsythia ovata]|uniref:Protein-tyrosine sulfotransferase-like n=1 Tax=Forsythia ovata TaxID=205694 RepID=A0ABD1RK21_9LAMI
MRCLSLELKLAPILLLLICATITTKAAANGDGYKQCEHTVKKWAFSSQDSEIRDDKHVLRNLLFFLHVPRTGGRTYFHCFLKKLYAGAQECPRSYDKLRFNPRKENCRLLSTHDDYSMMAKLPKEQTSVVTILRNPIDRVFSTYEFSVEVAARFLVHRDLTSLSRMAKRARLKAGGVSTLDIWPWKYLVPWMREDLFARRDARIRKGQSYIITNDTYDMEEISMPLRDFINDPIARDIIHNGATFQIAGLTNNSYLVESHEVRRCVLKYQSLGQYVLEVVKKRLDSMLYVGLTENHRESATMFSNLVGAQVIAQLTKSSSNSDFSIDNGSEQRSLLPNSKSDANHQENNTYRKLKKVSSTSKDEAENINMDAGKLMEAYESCISSLRNSQSERRAKSLKRISPANYTKEARRKVPELLLQEITSLNSLDMQLYDYAQNIFAKQQALMVQNMVNSENLPSTLDERAHNNSYSLPSWKVIVLAMTSLLDLQVVNLTLRVLSRPEVNRLSDIFKTLGLEYDEKVLPSIGNEVLKAVVAQFNADQFLTERPHVSALVRESLIRRAKDFNIILDDVFSRAVEQKQVAQQKAERSKFVVAKAEQERRAAIIRAEEESESAKLISDATAATGMGLIELRRIDASKENTSTMSKNPNSKNNYVGNQIELVITAVLDTVLERFYSIFGWKRPFEQYVLLCYTFNQQFT